MSRPDSQDHSDSSSANTRSYKGETRTDLPRDTTVCHSQSRNVDSLIQRFETQVAVREQNTPRYTHCGHTANLNRDVRPKSEPVSGEFLASNTAEQDTEQSVSRGMIGTPQSQSAKSVSCQPRSSPGSLCRTETASSVMPNTNIDVTTAPKQGSNGETAGTSQLDRGQKNKPPQWHPSYKRAISDSVTTKPSRKESLAGRSRSVTFSEETENTKKKRLQRTPTPFWFRGELIREEAITGDDYDVRPDGAGASPRDHKLSKTNKNDSLVSSKAGPSPLLQKLLMSSKSRPKSPTPASSPPQKSDCQSSPPSRNSVSGPAVKERARSDTD